MPQGFAFAFAFAFTTALGVLVFEVAAAVAAAALPERAGLLMVWGSARREKQMTESCHIAHSVLHPPTC
jgi:hypothetical protein